MATNLKRTNTETTEPVNQNTEPEGKLIGYAGDTQLAVPTATSKMTIGKGTGETRPEDRIMPDLRLVHGTSNLADSFEPGKFVLSREKVVADDKTAARITVLTYEAYWLEDLPMDSEVKPKRFATEAEVIRAGGTTQWVDDVAPSYTPVMDVILAVEGSCDDALYPFLFMQGDDQCTAYAIAKWVLRGTAYKRAGRLIKTAQDWNLRDGLHKGSWTLQSTREKLRNGKLVFVPVMKAGPKNSPELVKFFESIL